MNEEIIVPSFPDADTLIQALSEVRKKLLITEKELSEKTGFSQPTISRLFCNRVRANRKRLSASYDHIAKLSKVFFDKLCQTEDVEYVHPMALILTRSGAIRVVRLKPILETTNVLRESQSGRKGFKR